MPDKDVVDMEEVDAEASMASYVAEVKQFRKEIDANIQKAETMLSGYPTELLHVSCAREISLVRTKLQEAKMWAGKILEVLGNPFPAELADKADVQ
jgi:hypothetical protein